MSCVPHFLLPLPTMQWATDLERDGHYLEQAYCFSEAQELRQRTSWTLGILIRMQHTSFISVIFVLLNRLLFEIKHQVSRFRDSAAKCHNNQRQLNVKEHTLYTPPIMCLSLELSLSYSGSPLNIVTVSCYERVRSAQCCVPRPSSHWLNKLTQHKQEVS